MRSRILFINRSYFPDAEATGQLLTELCEDLAVDFDVTVIAGQPNQNPQQLRHRRWGREFRQGVRIQRVWNSRLPKSWLPLRALNLLSFLVSATVTGLFLRRPDIVVVETDPPLLCLLGALLKTRFRCSLLIYLQDIHPELGIALGRFRPGRRARALHAAFAWAYRRADRMIVLSDDMRAALLRHYAPVPPVEVLPNWTDTQRILVRKTKNGFREKHQLADQFVVMYSGNLGLCQGLENILEAARQLRSHPGILFLLIGDGALKLQLERQATRDHLDNIRFLDYQPKCQLSESLGAADVHLVPVAAEACDYLMPSKLYGILASGTPVITVAPETSELAQLVETEGVGWNVPPEAPQQLADQILWARNHRHELTSPGERARELAVARFDRTVSVAAFRSLLHRSMPGHASPQPVPVER